MKVIVAILLAISCAILCMHMVFSESDKQCERIENAISLAKDEILDEIRNASNQAFRERLAISLEVKENGKKLDTILSIANSANQDFK